jgi:hypothetical protein
MGSGGLAGKKVKSMDLSFFSLFCVIAGGAGLSFAVWMSGLLIRKRLRGPGRLIIMTILLIVWYVTLYPLLNNDSLEPGTQRAYQIGIHSIWIWWVWALMRFLKRAKAEAKRTNWKTGVYTATGLHRVSSEVRKIREKREAEKAAAEAAKQKAADADFMPDI